jgi:alpha-aminoadipic semialdehyde synthase
MLPRHLPLGRTPSWSSRHLTTLGIRKEDPARIWERRAPLTPTAVSQLLQESRRGALGEDEVLVQVESCKRRCFPDSTYAQVGSVPSTV